jgi:hypothetical protein
MVTSTIISDYSQYGLHSARPATPNVPAGVTALYYETDTAHVFAWSGTAWVQVDSAGGGGVAAPTIVQSAFASGAAVGSVTFGAAPTNGNLLVAFILKTNPGPNTGWFNPWGQDGTGIGFSVTFFKICGAGESATQAPFSGTAATNIAVYEIANACPVNPDMASGGGTAQARSCKAFGTAGIIIGAVGNEQTSALPSSITGAVLDGSAVGTATAVQGFHKTAGITKGIAANAFTVNYAVSTSGRFAAMYIGASG